ncbi:hypothetical protein ACOMHN_029105 [Nucella lapillus]
MCGYLLVLFHIMGGQLSCRGCRQHVMRHAGCDVVPSAAHRHPKWSGGSLACLYGRPLCGKRDRAAARIEDGMDILWQQQLPLQAGFIPLFPIPSVTSSWLSLHS